MTARPLALFRCDASASIGAGHVSRCLALAEALADAGWRIGFVVGADTLSIVPALAKSGYALRVLEPYEQDVAILCTQAAAGADLLVVDHYKKGASFETGCRSFARKILVLDDATGRRHECDILVDAGAVGGECYAGLVPSRARVLTGPAYALLRRSFTLHRDEALTRRDGRQVKKILVSCGATDPANATAAILDVLDDVTSEIPVVVVLSSKATHVDAIRARSGSNVRLLLDVENMAELMSNADLGIGAAGSTAFERAVLGLPAIVVALADNQRGVAQLMSAAGGAADAGTLDCGFGARMRGLVKTLLTDSSGRVRMAKAAATLVDGRGAVRIMLENLNAVPAKDGTLVRLRLANADDEASLLNLQSQPCTRRHFRNSAIPGEAEHHQWMVRTLADSDRLLLMVETDEKVVGMLRLDRLPEQDGRPRYEIAVAVDQNWANRGIGGAALALGRRLNPRAIFDAEIAPENIASQRTFAASGFKLAGNKLYRSEPA